MKTVLACAILIMLALICCGCTTAPSSPAASTGASSATVSVAPPGTISNAGGTGATIQIRIRENSFDPNFVTVKVGTTVVWTNEDQVAHTVTYTGTGATKFDSGNLAKGQSFSNTFMAPGRYIYADTQRSFMTGTIVVE
jgi:plastocyanin